MLQELRRCRAMVRQPSRVARSHHERRGSRILRWRRFAGLARRGAADSKSNSWLYRREVGPYGLRASDAIEQMRAVTIAQVHGYAVGGGVVLMAVCDLRVAAEDAWFFIPEIDLGLPLAWGGIPKLVREIGPAMTKELVMTCRRFSPMEAKQMGFVNRVVPLAKLAERDRGTRPRTDREAVGTGRDHQRTRQRGDARDGRGNYRIRRWRQSAWSLGY